MKKKYIIPETHTVTVNLISSMLEPGYGNWSQGAAGGDDPGFGDAKENNLVEEEEILPTQPNLWGDEED